MPAGNTQEFNLNMYESINNVKINPFLLASSEQRHELKKCLALLREELREDAELNMLIAKSLELSAFACGGK